MSTVEKFGPFYFVDNEVKVRQIDIDAEIEKRGGIEVVVANAMKHNALLARMAKPKPGKPKPGC